MPGNGHYLLHGLSSSISSYLGMNVLELVIITCFLRELHTNSDYYRPYISSSPDVFINQPRTYAITKLCNFGPINIFSNIAVTALQLQSYILLFC